MSLTLPTAYSNSSKLGNIQENWIIQLGFFNGDAHGSGEGGWDAVKRANGAANLLTADVNNSTTTIPVDDGTVFSANDYLKIESEIVKVVSISSNDLTVVRTQMGTSAEAHEDDDVIYWNNFTPISLADTTVDNVFYHGTITNVPSIRSSIDLANSTAKTGNISLSIANFQYKGDDFSAELFLGTRKYINRNVKIYSQLNGDSTLANCLQIYQGRLTGVSHDDASISLQITEQRPWDFITIPQDRTTRSKQYYTLSYGDFTPNTSTRASQAFCDDKNLYPINVDNLTRTHLIALQGRSLDGNSGNEGRLHYYEKNADAFVPLTLSNNTYQNISISSYDANGNAVRIDNDLYRGFICKPSGLNDEGDSAYWNDPINVYDISGDDSGYSTYARETLAISSNQTQTTSIWLDVPEVEGKITSMKMKVRYRLDVDESAGSSGLNYSASLINITDGLSQTIINIEEDSGTKDTGNVISSLLDMDSQLSDNDYKLLNPIKLQSQLVYGAGSGTVTANWYIYDVHIYIQASLDFATNRDAATKTANDIKQLYIGANGLTNSWDSSAISYGHEAHRDMLIRFAGYTTTAPGNWSALDEDRTRNTADSGDISTWKIRWWELEPVDLKKVLEQLQYEFGFIFKFRADGTGAMIYIIQTSEMQTIADSGSPYPVFNNSDINNLSISNSSLSNLLTKMEINYEKHPANKSYMSSVTSSNATTRTNYNIQAKENIKEVNLDMSVGTPSTSGQTDGNTDFYSYYDNILGDIKKIISCDIVNPAKSYSLETGDIVQFSNTAGEMPVEPFGDNWADYYMITDLKRSPGNVSITAREVG